MRVYLAVLMVLLFIAASLRFGPRPAVDDAGRWQRGPSEPPSVIAHAGGIDLFPANTMAAFRGSAALGVDMLEMDLQLTADDALVTMHDATVDRTTEGAGRVRDLALDAVLSLDASTGWVRHDGTDPYADQRVPPAALESVLATFSGTHLGFVVELKNSGNDGARAASVLADALVRHGVESRTIVASFHGETIRAFREASGGRVTTAGAADELRLGLLATRLGLDAIWYHPREIGALQVPLRAAGLNLAVSAVIDRAHARGQAVQHWTINAPEAMAHLLELGADGIMTDNPAELRRVLAAGGHALPPPLAEFGAPATLAR